jgi:hypothetical protein
MRLGRHLVELSPTLIRLDSPDTRKRFFFQLFIILGPFVLFIDLIGWGSGMKVPEFHWDDPGEAFVFYFFHFIPIASFIMWLITKPAFVFFDRASKEVLYKSGNLEIRYPWSSIRFDSGWLPTKTGGVHYLSVKAGPPFPEIVLKKNARKLAKSGNQEYFIGLGGFDCRNGDEVRAYMRFFEGFMETDEPMEKLLRQFRGG